jgi:hypothetical protein
MVSFQNGIGDIPRKGWGMDTGIYQKGQKNISIFDPFAFSSLRKKPALHLTKVSFSCIM